MLYKYILLFTGTHSSKLPTKWTIKGGHPKKSYISYILMADELWKSNREKRGEWEK